MERKLVVQIHPKTDGSDSNPATFLRSVLGALVPAKDWRIEQSKDGWLNFEIRSSKISEIWHAMHAEFAKDPSASEKLSERWIVVAHGHHGWNDYKLLAHFDPSITLDELPLDK